MYYYGITHHLPTWYVYSKYIVNTRYTSYLLHLLCLCLLLTCTPTLTPNTYLTKHLHVLPIPGTTLFAHLIHESTSI